MTSHEQSRQVIRRGDGFDIGTPGPAKDGGVVDLLSNPSQLAEIFKMTDKQAANVRSLIVGAGTGGIHRLLSQHLGDEVAGAIGGLLSGYLSHKLFGGK